MRKKIAGYLGLFSIVSLLLAAILTGGLLVRAFTAGEKEAIQTYAAAVARRYEEGKTPEELAFPAPPSYRITWIAPDGTIRLDSGETILSEEPLRLPEVEQARLKGTGQAADRSGALRIYAYAQVMKDGMILRVAGEWPAIPSILENALPVAAGGMIILAIATIILALLVSGRLLRPIERLTARLDELFLPSEKKSVYPELLPFLTEIGAQRRKIATQLQSIEQEANKLNAVMQHLSEGLIILDKDKRILILNESAKTFLRCPDLAPGQRLPTASGEKTEGEQVRDNCVYEALCGRSCTQNFELDDKTIQLLASPVLHDGRPMGALLLLLDVTEKSQMERLKQEFTANVSHELKTPLTSISGYAEMIETGIARQEDIKAFAARIHKEAGRLLSLISDILKLSELDEAGRAFPKEPVSLLELAQEAADSLRQQAAAKRVAIAVEGQGGTVYGHRRMLFELLYNLCDNAIRYNHPDGSVTVTAAQRTLTVQDTGIGIPSQHQQRIFERFYRVDKSRSKETGGTGLGLAIVKHVAQEHDARIEIQSHTGQGTTITVRFPSN